MNNHNPFLDAIRETDSDDTPRLIYADWLEERGDPRAEFIRVQCELAKLQPYHERYAELHPREQELLDQYEAQWRSELPYVYGVAWGSSGAALSIQW